MKRPESRNCGDREDEGKRLTGKILERERERESGELSEGVGEQ